MHSIKGIFITIILLGLGSVALASDYILLAGNANHNLSQELAIKLHVPGNLAQVGRFNDGEISIKIAKSVRDKDVYIIQSISKSETGSVNDNLMELYLMIRTLKRASCGKITAIIPYFGYARQDRKNESRVPISASDVAMLLENSGVDRVVALDLHAGQIQGFFHNVPVDNIYGSVFMAPQFAELKLKDPVIVSPDAGGVARAKKFRDTLSMYGVKADLAIIIKQRAGAGVIESANLIGDVKGRDVIIVDDICDTGGTLVKAAEELKKFGANKVYASITHPVFSKDAIAKIEKSEFEQVYVSDSIVMPAGKYKKITQVSVANLLAMVVDHLDHGESLSELFIPHKSYIDEYGVSKIITPETVYPQFKDTKQLLLNETKSVNVLVTSNSEIKIKAAETIFRDKFKVATSSLKVTGIKTKSNVNSEPIGLEQAMSGAQNRIKDLKQHHNSSNYIKPYIVSIENFFTELRKDHKPTDHALVIIENPQGEQYMYLSVGVEIAPDLYNTALQQNEATIGEILSKKYNVRADDWHSYVTANKIDRLQQIVSAVQN